MRAIAPMLGLERGLSNSVGLVIIIIALYLLQGKFIFTRVEIVFLIVLSSVIVLKTIFLIGTSSLPMLDEGIRFLLYAFLYGLTVKLELRDIHRFFKFIFYGLIVLGYYQILTSSGITFEEGYGDNYISVQVVSGHAVNQNAFAVLIVLSSLFVHDNYLSRNQTIWGYIVLFLTFYLVFSTGSRTALIAYFVGLSVIFELKQRKFIAAIVLFLIISMLINLGAVLSESDLIAQKGLNSLYWRLSAWHTLLADFNMRFLLIGELKYSIYDKLSQAKVFATTEPHSDIVRSIYYFGLIAVLPYMFALSSARNFDRAVRAIIFAVVIMSLTENV